VPVTDKDAVDGPGAGTDTEGAEDNKGLVSLSWASDSLTKGKHKY